MTTNGSMPPGPALPYRPPAGGSGLLTALALFAVICGLMLLTTGGFSGQVGDTPEVARHKRMVEASKAAAAAGDKAKGAINSANYGAAKQIIEQQQKQIIRLQVELEAAAPAPPAK